MCFPKSVGPASPTRLSEQSFKDEALGKACLELSSTDLVTTSKCELLGGACDET